MFQKLFKNFTDFQFLSPIITHIYKLRNPEEVVIAYGAAKGCKFKTDQSIKRGLHWVIAKRATLILTNKFLIIGNFFRKWKFQLNEVESLELIKARSLGARAMILKFKAKNGSYYQIGFQEDENWINQKVVPINIIEGKIASSPLSLIVRALFVILLIGYIYEITTGVDLFKELFSYF